MDAVTQSSPGANLVFKESAAAWSSQSKTDGLGAEDGTAICQSASLDIAGCAWLDGGSLGKKWAAQHDKSL
ncbi:hypothetical protein OUZ56_003262 [Daphnia magna]|uniref:Uncharacterized protein n=1 Tax=Daphnia magna TaxID=35525 RepID=A0ABR0A886_9CRUS|nr:hypothetical protein OUZ56_003262 [Daphnia magna]